jgi:hypothetical protein
MTLQFFLRQSKKMILGLSLLSPLTFVKLATADDLGTSSSGGGNAYLSERSFQFVLNRTQLGLGVVDDVLVAMINYNFPLYDKNYAPKKFENGNYLLKSIAGHAENLPIVDVLEKMQDEVKYPRKAEQFKSAITYTSSLKFKLLESCQIQATDKDSDACYFIENGKKTIGLIANRVKNLDEESFLALLAHEVAHAYGATERTAQDFQLYFIVFRAFIKQAPSIEFDLHKVYLNQMAKLISEKEKLSNLCSSIEKVKTESAVLFNFASQALESHTENWEQKTESPAAKVVSRIDQLQKSASDIVDKCRWFTDPLAQDYKDQLGDVAKKDYELAIQKAKSELLDANSESMSILYNGFYNIL